MPFPTTHWSLLDAVKGEKTPAHRHALDSLMKRYYAPTFARLRRRGFAEADAKDLVQSFFEHGLHKDLFGRADRERGRFRNFYLTALDRHVANAVRDRKARVQRTIDPSDLAPADLPAADDSPEAEFFRAFAAATIRRLLEQFHKHCLDEDQSVHFEVFRRRIIEPALDGIASPSDAELAAAHGLSPKQVGNLLITAKRTFRRMLKAEVDTYAANEADADAEVRELMGFFPMRD